MLRYLLIFPALIIVFVMFVSLYLQPNDFKNCLDIPSESTRCKSADAIVAVSGGDTSARASEAISLYKKGWAKWLIFSGAALDKSGPSNAAAMKVQAIKAGVSEDVILLDEYSDTTRENAANTESIFSEHNISDAILVTSGYHQKRANIEFRREASEVSIRNHPVAQDKDWSGWWWATPRGWYLAVTELVKITALNFGGSR